MYLTKRVVDLVSLIAVCASLSSAIPIVPSGVLNDTDTCPGSFEVGGFGTVELVATQWNIAKDPAGKVEVDGNRIIPHFNGRSYWADTCNPGQYNNSQYLRMPLLGKALTFTTDLSEAGCGCNVAFYLTNLNQNSDLSTCKDYYCDANSVCGVMCPEIDIMEANRHAFWSTLHTEDDKSGVGIGYGGGGADWNGRRTWNSADYGLGGMCIDTTKPFQVTAGFPINSNGDLEAMTINLWQQGKTCNLSATISHYDGNQTKTGAGSNLGMPALTKALALGMTPIASLWGTDDMAWLDGPGKDKLGPCEADTTDNCPAMAELWDFYLEDLPPPAPATSPFVLVAALVVVLCLVAVVAKVMLSKSQRSVAGGPQE